ncbi:MFS transporter [Nocardia sp. 348MFTsu5.1]|uniref:MFS transporter n=1 Tax=Nocardia sp. 348MFTsu5.1 TaxID=1172185 RepID=UPI000372FA40|nr:MFS transporter [Nocardia sp. 348MFTsu5.1]
MPSTRSPWFSLAALCLPMLIVSMDVSVLFFAVPFISADLDPSPAQQLWIFDIYGFVLAGLLLAMGAVADRIGHRRLLLIGAAGFSVASVLAAYATSAEMLIGARALLAVSGATLMPSTLALVRHIFTDETQRAKAVATWTAVMTGGVAVGPIISGILLEHFWWGSVFLINIPVMVLLVIVAPILLPGDTGDRKRRIDALSSLLVLITILPVIEGVKAIAADGWSPAHVAYLVLGVAAGLMFVRRQHHLAEPLVDLTLFADRRFSTTIWINLIAMFGILGNAIMMTQYLQSVLGRSPLSAAVWSLLPSIAIALVAPLAAVLASRIGRPPVMVGGLLVAGGGFVILAAFTTTDSLVSVLVGATFLAGGLVATSAMVYDYVVGVTPAERAGAVAGLLETTTELGGALGIAILGSVVNMVYHNTFQYSGASDDSARESLGGALAIARGLPANTGDALVDAARAAFVNGVAVASLVGAVVMVLTALAAIHLLRQPADAASPSTAVY